MSRKIIELRSRPEHMLFIETAKILEVEVVKSPSCELRVIIRYAGGTKKHLTEPQASEFVKEWQKRKGATNSLSWLSRLLS
jgi:hypothetical protein